MNLLFLLWTSALHSNYGLFGVGIILQRCLSGETCSADGIWKCCCITRRKQASCPAWALLGSQGTLSNCKCQYTQQTGRKVGAIQEEEAGSQARKLLGFQCNTGTVGDHEELTGGLAQIPSQRIKERRAFQRICKKTLPPYWQIFALMNMIIKMGIAQR